MTEWMTLTIAEDKMHFVCFTTFSNTESADKACKQLNGHPINDCTIRAALYSIRNLNNELYDFVPNDEDTVSPDVLRSPPPPVWHVTTYKEGRDNFIRASECIQNKVGNIPFENLKRYGKSILIKAGNDTQAAILSHFQPPENGNVKSISPHRSF